jgi:hypothetical protein
MTAPDDSWTLGDARAWMGAHIEEGTVCFLCTRTAKIYKRRINVNMVRALIALYRGRYNERDGYLHLPSVDPSRGEAARLRFWGLIEEEKRVRPDGGHAGWWRITEAGEAWLEGQTSVDEYARTYAGQLLELCGKPYWVQDAVKERFDLRELMKS